jgi:dTDP-4-amino-4,6-dideoxygalactose transaminase
MKKNSISQYEMEFSTWFGAKRSFSFWKGRVALYAILKALNVGVGDEVVLPGYTCVMNVNPIKYVGAKPVYVDIEPETFNMNVELLEEKITANTKVIIAQHTYGYPCDMETIMAIAVRYGVAVVEDCCLSFGSKYKGKTVGTFGEAAYFSFQWNKPYTTGLGGMALVNDLRLAEKIESLRAKESCRPSKMETLMLVVQLAVYRAFIYPRTTPLAQAAFRFLTKKGFVVGSSSMCEFEPKMAPDFFKVMSGIQARSGLKQLIKVDSIITRRRKIAQLYDQLLEEKGWAARKYNRAVMEPVMVRYPVRINGKHKALAEAAKAGVELGSWFECPLHPIETPLEVYDYQLGMCKESEKASREVVNLPLHPRTDEKTAKRTVEFITRFTKVI